MFDVLINSIVLFCKGKLFQDTAAAVRQALIGVAVTAFVCVVCVKSGAPLFLSVVIAAACGGLIQPWLFKNLKYR